MVMEINGLELNYETAGDGEPLLWLHGFHGRRARLEVYPVSLAFG